MNTIINIITSSVLGASILSIIIAIKYYAYLKLPLIGKYVMYLFFCCANFLFLSLFFKEISTNDSSIPSQVNSIFFITEFIFYYSFVTQAFGITAKTNYKLWILLKIACWVIGIHALLFAFIRYYYGETNSTEKFLTVSIITNAYIIPATIYGFIYCVKNANTLFKRLILAGMIFSFASTYTFIAFKTMPTPNHEEMMSIGLLIFSIGIFLELLFFSTAMILKVTQIIEDNAVKIKNIEYLNSTNQLLIIELEQENRIIEMEVQKKMGMELHDSFAGALASIRIRLENEAINIPDKQLQLKLESLKDEISIAYDYVREKSHQLYHTPMPETGNQFSQKIEALLENILPSNRFEKDINVDLDSFENLRIEIKIELLKIIQEASLNILKHAKANKISILFYKDLITINLSITDNGKGFDLLKKTKGIGLNSMKKRVLDLGGTLEIKSNKSGTTLDIAIPLSAVRKGSPSLKKSDFYRLN